MSDRARRARALLAGHHYNGAAAEYRELLGQTHAAEQEYLAWLSGMTQALLGLMGDPRQDETSRQRLRRALAYTKLYQLDFSGALNAITGPLADGSLLGDEQAYALARGQILEQRGDAAGAGEVYRQHGRMLLAAIALERAGQDAEARDAWERARQALPRGAGTYERALVHFNLGNCCMRLQDITAGQSYMVTAQRLLEESADEFESDGLRERAFDCYQILLELGRRSGAFENLSEGYVNCIRILGEDGLKYYVLQFYEDFLKAALEQKEFHAAATLYQEAAEYCLRAGLLYHPYYMLAAAKSWIGAARHNLTSGGPPELSENAYLAAVECFNSMGNYQGVGEAYASLSVLDLPARKRERYQRIARRYAGAQPTRLADTQSLPEYLRQAHAYPEIWYHDLVELEHGGDPESVCAQVLGDAKGFPAVVRRRALTTLLLLLEGSEAQAAGAERLAEVAEGLGDMQIYPVLCPLERLLEHPDRQVQQGVMRALRFLFFKRSFGPLRNGLDSRDAGVRNEALQSLAKLHFRHAFDPLVRIFREHRETEVRLTALRSVGQIPSLEAGDFLVEVLRQEPEPLRGEAKRLLMAFDSPELVPVLKQHYQMETGDLRQDLGEILARHRGE